ncbi:hypothetical protein B0J14DRAFT_651510 [Halenospora varia]|nr:hypothetical protein B0J14DRAFT_651510 [Halenospora varia]
MVYERVSVGARRPIGEKEDLRLGSSCVFTKGTSLLPLQNSSSTSFLSLGSITLRVMDPLYILASITGIASVCIRTVTTLDAVRSNFSNAHITITALASQCRALTSSHSQLQKLANGNESIREQEDLTPTFTTALTACDIVFSCFKDKLNRINKAKGGQKQLKLRILRDKASIFWNEDEMRVYVGVGNLWGHLSVVSFLIQLLHI